MNYVFHLIIYFGIYTTLGLGLNLILRFGGFLSLAHAAYFAVGAYLYALISLKADWSFPVIIGVVLIFAGALSLLLSLPAWRLKGDFFVMITLAVQNLVYTTLYNWSSALEPVGSWKNLTNGPFGLPGIPRPAILGVKFDTTRSMALLSIVIALSSFVIYKTLIHSPWGRVIAAMRDDELAARGLGKNTRVLKVQVFAIACGMAAIAGALYAAYLGYIDPGVAVLDQSILAVSMVVIGGTTSLKGPIWGVLVLLSIPEILRFIQLPSAVAADVRVLVYGLLLLWASHMRPGFLSAIFRRYTAYVIQRIKRTATTTTPSSSSS